MNKLILFLTSLLLVAFLAGAACTQRYQSETVIENMYYLKDYRTNLCFAMSRSQYFTHVPCTPEVEKLVVNIYQLEK